MTAEISKENVDISRVDWDSFETSWDFAEHPLVVASHGLWDQTSVAASMQHYYGDNLPEARSKLELCWLLWQGQCRERFDRLKANEEELNRIFARIYHMEGEVPVEVPDDKVSVRLADLARDARSLISYGVGCMFGRYSTYKQGLVLADQGKGVADFLEMIPHARFVPDEDNVLPVLDDERFEDDIVSGFRAWLADAFGREELEANVAWLEESLGKDLRTYFCKDFYADHAKTYRSRPIYWMFQSPGKTFQCLVYMHRYDEGTVGTILTGYLRPLEDKLRAELSTLDSAGASAADVKRADEIRRDLADLEDWERDVIYTLAHARVSIDLDDGVKVNYNKFPRALAKVSGLSEWK